MRGVLVLVLLAGCDAIFGVDPPDPPDAGDAGAGEVDATPSCAEWFEVRPSASAGSAVVALTTAQLDLTPAREIVAATASGYTVFAGDALGSYVSTRAYTTEVEAPTAIVGADLEGDGLDELVMLHRASDRIDVYGEGGSGYTHIGGLDTGDGPEGLAVVDLDGQGGLDLVWGTRGAKRVEVALRSGNGYPQATVADNVPEAVSVLATGDVNDDGDVDLVVGWGNRFSVFVNDGAATFASTDGPAILTTVHDLALGDVDGAPGDELVALTRPFVSVLMYTGSTFETPRPFMPQLEVHRIALADLDRDGLLDLVIAGAVTNGGRVEVYQGRPGGLFDDVVELPVPGPAIALTLADLDADGRLDIAAVAADGSLAVYRNCR